MEGKEILAMYSNFGSKTEWHGGQTNFWAPKGIMDFLQLRYSVSIPSIHNGIDVKIKKRDGIEVSPNFLVVWMSGHLL